MTIAYRAGSTTFPAAATDVGSFVLNKPTGTVQNDEMLVHVAIYRAGPSTTVSIGSAGQWTLVRRTDLGTHLSLLTYSRVAGASEPASWTVTLGASVPASGAIRSFSGTFNTIPDPIEAWNENSSAVAGTSLVANAVQGGANTWLAVACMGDFHTGGADLTPATIAPPGSPAFVERFDGGTYSAFEFAISSYHVHTLEGADVAWGGGTMSNMTFTANKSLGAYITHTILLRDALGLPQDHLGGVGL